MVQGQIWKENYGLQGPGQKSQKNLDHFSICACHPCAGAMLIFSVSFQFYRMSPKWRPGCSARGYKLLIFSVGFRCGIKLAPQRAHGNHRITIQRTQVASSTRASVHGPPAPSGAAQSANGPLVYLFRLTNKSLWKCGAFLCNFEILNSSIFFIPNDSMRIGISIQVSSSVFGMVFRPKFRLFSIGAIELFFWDPVPGWFIIHQIDNTTTF